MFNTNELNKRIAALEATIESEKRSHANEIAELERDLDIEKQDHAREIAKLKDQHAHETKLAQAEVDLEIRQAAEEYADEKNKLLVENATQKKEIAMYETAFKNLGFDVKDMKEILNKLVDGLVSKNTVNVVK